MIVWQLNGDNSLTQVADQAINPLTNEVDLSNTTAIVSHIGDTLQLRERMKLLLDVIIRFSEDE